MSQDLCPCCSNKPFNKCCGPFLDGNRHPKTLKHLVRSRYTAYKLGGYGAYLLKSWHPNYSGGLTASSLSIRSTDWQSLTVVDTAQQGNAGGVEFKAYYLDKDGAELCHHELSRFVRVKGKWLYIEGKVTIE